MMGQVSAGKLKPLSLSRKGVGFGVDINSLVESLLKLSDIRFEI
jgi:hypothetical protein